MSSSVVSVGPTLSKQINSVSLTPEDKLTFLGFSVEDIKNEQLKGILIKQGPLIYDKIKELESKTNFEESMAHAVYEQKFGNNVFAYLVLSKYIASRNWNSSSAIQILFKAFREKKIIPDKFNEKIIQTFIENIFSKFISVDMQAEILNIIEQRTFISSPSLLNSLLVIAGKINWNSDNKLRFLQCCLDQHFGSNPNVMVNLVNCLLLIQCSSIKEQGLIAQIVSEQKFGCDPGVELALSILVCRISWSDYRAYSMLFEAIKNGKFITAVQSEPVARNLVKVLVGREWFIESEVLQIINNNVILLNNEILNAIFEKFIQAYKLIKKKSDFETITLNLHQVISHINFRNTLEGLHKGTNTAFASGVSSAQLAAASNSTSESKDESDSSRVSRNSENIRAQAQNKTMNLVIECLSLYNTESTEFENALLHILQNIDSLSAQLLKILSKIRIKNPTLQLILCEKTFEIFEQTNSDEKQIIISEMILRQNFGCEENILEKIAIASTSMNWSNPIARRNILLAIEQKKFGEKVWEINVFSFHNINWTNTSEEEQNILINIMEQRRLGVDPKNEIELIKVLTRIKWTNKAVIQRIVKLIQEEKFLTATQPEISLEIAKFLQQSRVEPDVVLDIMRQQKICIIRQDILVPLFYCLSAINKNYLYNNEEATFIFETIQRVSNISDELLAYVTSCISLTSCSGNPVLENHLATFFSRNKWSSLMIDIINKTKFTDTNAQSIVAHKIVVIVQHKDNPGTVISKFHNTIINTQWSNEAQEIITQVFLASRGDEDKDDDEDDDDGDSKRTPLDFDTMFNETDVNVTHQVDGRVTRETINKSQMQRNFAQFILHTKWTDAAKNNLFQAFFNGHFFTRKEEIAIMISDFILQKNWPKNILTDLLLVLILDTGDDYEFDRDNSKLLVKYSDFIKETRIDSVDENKLFSSLLSSNEISSSREIVTATIVFLLNIDFPINNSYGYHVLKIIAKLSFELYQYFTQEMLEMFFKKFSDTIGILLSKREISINILLLVYLNRKYMNENEFNSIRAFVRQSLIDEITFRKLEQLTSNSEEAQFDLSCSQQLNDSQRSLMKCFSSSSDELVIKYKDSNKIFRDKIGALFGEIEEKDGLYLYQYNSKIYLLFLLPETRDIILKSYLQNISLNEKQIIELFDSKHLNLYEITNDGQFKRTEVTPENREHTLHYPLFIRSYVERYSQLVQRPYFRVYKKLKLELIDRPEISSQLTEEEKASLSYIIYFTIEHPSYSGSQGDYKLKKQYSDMLGTIISQNGKTFFEDVTTVLEASDFPVSETCYLSPDGRSKIEPQLQRWLYLAYLFGKLASASGLGWKILYNYEVVHLRLEQVQDSLKPRDFKKGEYVICRNSNFDEYNRFVLLQANGINFTKFPRLNFNAFTAQVKEIFKRNKDLSDDKFYHWHEDVFNSLITSNNGPALKEVIDNDSNYLYRQLSIHFLEKCKTYFSTLREKFDQNNPSDQNLISVFTKLSQYIEDITKLAKSDTCMFVAIGAIDAHPTLSSLINYFYNPANIKQSASRGAHDGAAAAAAANAGA